MNGIHSVQKYVLKSKIVDLKKWDTNVVKDLEE
jgi:hypothetical protein